MMKSLTWVVAGFFLLLSVTVAGAQCVGIAGTITLVGPVTGAPFTADFVHVFEPLNRDGSRSHQVAHGKVYRDSEGRARCEVNGKTGEPKFVIITDPVAGLKIAMNPEKQTAIVTHHPSSPFAPVQGTPATRAKTAADVQPQGTHTEEDLPSQVIEGFTVTGKRYVNTSESGETSTMENWYSPDLKFKLLSTVIGTSANISDKLINVRIGDPDQKVFQVPEGYTVTNKYCRGQVCNYDSE